ncbi:hypothetical protein E2I00_006990, partial [Balaenoptera physalus]
EQMVKSMLLLAPKLNEANLTVELMKLFTQLQAEDEQGPIWCNTTICLGKISSYFSTSTRHRPTRSCLSSYSLTVDSETSVQDEAFKAIRSCLSKLESVSQGPTQLAEVDFSCSQLGRLGRDRGLLPHLCADPCTPHSCSSRDQHPPETHARGTSFPSPHPYGRTKTGAAWSRRPNLCRPTRTSGVLGAKTAGLGRAATLATKPRSQTGAAGKLRGSWEQGWQEPNLPELPPENTQLASEYNWDGPELNDKGDPFATLSARQRRLVPSRDRTLGIDDHWEVLETESQQEKTELSWKK